METLIAGGIFLLLFIGIALLQARVRGKIQERLKQAKDDKEAMKDYEKIGSNPPVDDPFSRMHKKD